MVLPAGFGLPPLPYLVGLLGGIGVVVGLLNVRRPSVTDRTVLGLVPWMVTGAALHVIYQIDAAPPVVRPLLGTPAVYICTAIISGTVWLLADQAADGATDTTAIWLGGVGTVAALGVIGTLVAVGSTLTLGWPAIGLILAAVVTMAMVMALRRIEPATIAITGQAGVIVLFAHTLDGISTAIGVDVLGFGERTPAARVIMMAAGRLPTADLIGVGWLFVIVKLIVAAAVVWLFTDYVRESPSEGYLLLAGVAAIGLGPGTHNLLLYMVS
ncbi:MAG: DUF63 family protein [Halobacteriales archaeon]|nr:DUF63 family protein [Halobacteriales archaeon]